jgi:hypothetical protein
MQPIYHVVPTECPPKCVEEPQTGGTVSKLEPSTEFAGAKVSLPVRGQFIAPLVIMAKLICDDLRAVYGISAGTGASSSAGIRKNLETTGRAFVVLLYLCSPKAIG